MLLHLFHYHTATEIRAMNRISRQNFATTHVQRGECPYYAVIANGFSSYSNILRNCHPRETAPAGDGKVLQRLVCICQHC